MLDRVRVGRSRTAPKRLAHFIVLVGLLGACSGSTTSAGSSSAMPSPSDSSASRSSDVEGIIADPLGDALLSSAPGYVDVRSAGVSEGGAALSFVATLAAPIPSSAEVPDDWDGLLWSFCLDTHGSSAPSGYPFAATTVVPCEFIVTALSEGGEVAGSLIDRRPLLHAKQVTRSPTPVALDGSTMTITVPAARLGHPARFNWVMATTALTLPWPNDDFLDIDEVPDSSFDKPARWPAGA